MKTPNNKQEEVAPKRKTATQVAVQKVFKGYGKAVKRLAKR